MRYSIYDRDKKTHTFPIATTDHKYDFGLVPADMVTHVMDEVSLGFVISVCHDTVTVLWSLPPKERFV